MSVQFCCFPRFCETKGSLNYFVTSIRSSTLTTGTCGTYLLLVVVREKFGSGRTRTSTDYGQRDETAGVEYDAYALRLRGFTTGRRGEKFRSEGARDLCARYGGQRVIVAAAAAAARLPVVVDDDDARGCGSSAPADDGAAACGQTTIIHGGGRLPSLRVKFRGKNRNTYRSAIASDAPPQKVLPR